MSSFVAKQAGPPCRIVDYRPELRGDFERLNRDWLERLFTLEPVDLKYFANPKQEILDRGGEIFFAETGNEIVGTATILDEEGRLELAKMAVTPSAQGRGIGALLVQEAIRRAKARGADKLMLVTNSGLAPAIALYRKLGFQEVFRGQHPKYKRGDLIMERLIR